MKLPLALSLMTTALGTTVLLGNNAVALPVANPFVTATTSQDATEASLLHLQNGAQVSDWLILASDDDDDEDDDDHDDDDDDAYCDDDDHEDEDEDEDEDEEEKGPCFGATMSPAPAGSVTPPDNGLFVTGTTPQVKSN